MLEQLRIYLLQRGITATVYINYLAASPDTAICIKNTPGRSPEDRQYNLPTIQVISRSDNYLTAFNNAQDLDRYLHAQNTYTTISGVIHIVDIWKLQDPYFIGRDDLNRYTFVQNFQIQAKG